MKRLIISIPGNMEKEVYSERGRMGSDCSGSESASSIWGGKSSNTIANNKIRKIFWRGGSTWWRACTCWAVQVLWKEWIVVRLFLHAGIFHASSWLERSLTLSKQLHRQSPSLFFLACHQKGKKTEITGYCHTATWWSQRCRYWQLIKSLTTLDISWRSR